MSDLYSKKCAGKLRYSSERKASEAARSSQRAFGTPMTSYECDFCKGFHVGNVFSRYSSTGRRLDDQSREAGDSP